MASYHFSIKSKQKGRAADHSNYIARERGHSRSDEDTDLITTGFGNMPGWTNGNPFAYWKTADQHERANGAACREWVLALPRELDHEQQQAMVQEMIAATIGDKPYQYAIHNPCGALDGIEQPHAHVIYSDRRPDGIERSAEQHFRRYNPTNPAAGGCRKDSGGKSPQALREEVVGWRETWAQIQNQALAKYGHEARVDHRSLEAQGIAREPESHLGPVRIKRMSAEQRAIHRDSRESFGQCAAEI
ncbi:MobA/MobL family protein [Cupriavidus basilensis]|uniref:MobA/MobL family protein n=1 Tax=Cupriavidus basilensis TaxID=68895 RepID=UPI00157B7AD1|nr:MobA/MobL family protein [Cupriavidus basilensis]NUA25988.1 plasmid mobilization protein [Cupriavidus basilensis]